MKKGILGLLSAVFVMLLVSLQTQSIMVPSQSTELHTNQLQEPLTVQIEDVKN